MKAAEQAPSTTARGSAWSTIQSRQRNRPAATPSAPTLTATTATTSCAGRSSTPERARSAISRMTQVTRPAAPTRICWRITGPDLP
ncbi:MAG: hypothetical protein ACXV2I_12680 [Actinomycetes bacterium]